MYDMSPGERTAAALAKKCEWLIELLVREEPRCMGDMIRTTGLSRRVMDDVVYALMQRGVLRLRPDAKLEAA